jgi:hypothetical protein
VRRPNERALWNEVQTLQAGVERRIADVLALSRQNQNLAARTRLVEGQKDHMDLDSKLVELSQLNLGGAGQPIEHVRALQQRAETIQWGTRIAGLVLLLLFGLWGTRRIVKYEKRITDCASAIEERNRDLDAFAGRVAHDLRNALGPIVLSRLVTVACGTATGTIVANASTSARPVLAAAVVAQLSFSKRSRRRRARERAPRCRCSPKPKTKPMLKPRFCSPPVT